MRIGLFKRRRLTALQVEVTSRCTRQCAVCPRCVLAHLWQDRDLQDSAWDRLRQDLRLVRHVHLQGWGEPLLHPRLPEMVDDAKRAGCEVGITTNGDLLEPAIDWIVEKSPNQIVLSVAGDAAAHADLRSGARLDELWTVLGRLVDRRGGKKLPRVKVSYLLTRRNCSQMPAIVEAAAEAGADELFAIHLDCTPTRELLEQSVVADADSISEGADALERAAAVARGRGIAFRAPRIAPQDVLVCSLDPPSIVFVRADGRVVPCVYLGLPVSGAIPRYSRDGTTEVETTVYGNLAEESLAEILDGERFRAFAAAFHERLAIERHFVDGIASRSALENLSCLDEADRRRERELEAHPFPAGCTGCQKVVGW